MTSVISVQTRFAPILQTSLQPSWEITTTPPTRPPSYQSSALYRTRMRSSSWTCWRLTRRAGGVHIYKYLTLNMSEDVNIWLSAFTTKSSSSVNSRCHLFLYPCFDAFRETFLGGYGSLCRPSGSLLRLKYKTRFALSKEEFKKPSDPNR